MNDYNKRIIYLEEMVRNLDFLVIELSKLITNPKATVHLDAYKDITEEIKKE